LADANKKAVYRRTHGVLSKQERAIHILEPNYGHGNRYSMDNMLKTVCLFQDRSKACVFLGLSASIVCDAWLKGLLDMEILLVCTYEIGNGVLLCFLFVFLYLVENRKHFFPYDTLIHYWLSDILTTYYMPIPCKYS